jgi:hypothetical protein
MPFRAPDPGGSRFCRKDADGEKKENIFMIIRFCLL